MIAVIVVMVSPIIIPEHLVLMVAEITALPANSAKKS